MTLTPSRPTLLSFYLFTSNYKCLYNSLILLMANDIKVFRIKDHWCRWKVKGLRKITANLRLWSFTYYQSIIFTGSFLQLSAVSFDYAYGVIFFFDLHLNVCRPGCGFFQLEVNLWTFTVSFCLVVLRPTDGSTKESNIERSSMPTEHVFLFSRVLLAS